MPLVLVVDDDAIIRSMVSRILEYGGHTTANAQDGQEALDLMDQIMPDLVITDLEMPGMGGRQLLDVLRLLHPQLPVLGMSGAWFRDPGAGELFDGCISKPFKLQDLLRSVDQSLLPEATVA